MIGEVGSALKRKLGPLPAWAWAGILAGGLIYYRRLKGQQDATGTPTSPVGEITDQTAAPSPTVLQPGETYVPPGFGGIVPGDDGTGTPAGEEPPAAGTPPGIAPKPKKTPKKKPKKKAKPSGRPAHPAHVGKAARPRASATVRHVVGRARTAAKKPVGRGRVTVAKPTAKKPAASSERTRTMPPAPAVRQRPAPPRVTNPVTQRTQANHSSAPAPKAPARAPARRRV